MSGNHTISYKSLLCAYDYNNQWVTTQGSRSHNPGKRQLLQFQHQNYTGADSCTLKGVVGFRGPISTAVPGLCSLEGTGFGIRFGCSRLQRYKIHVIKSRHTQKRNLFNMQMFKLTRILLISVHTLFSEQLPCRHTSASS